MTPLRLIINGDDFGRHPGVNAGIVRAHQEGVLTGASLMVTGAAWREAVALARDLPSLAVGLHAALTAVSPALPPHRLPHLTGRDGYLSANPFAVGVRCFFSPRTRSEVCAELTAQFEAFAATGLPLAHVDGHYLFHLHPTVFPLLIELAERYGAAGIRLPRDDLRLALRLDRTHLGTKVAWKAVYALLCRLGERRLRATRLVYTDRVYGLLNSGCMHEHFVTQLIRSIPAHVHSAEMYFHPSVVPLGDSYGPNPGDLAALTSPRVRAAIQGRGAELISYPALLS